jgi:phenylacetate-CoA ligase
MSAKRLLGRRVLLPAYDLAKGTDISGALSELEQAAGWSKPEIGNYQLIKLKKLLLHAYENVPFYRKRLDSAGLSPADFRELQDLVKIPPLTREDIQNSHDGMLASNIDISRCYKGSSSGSTGEPVRYMRDRRCSSVGKAALYFGWSMSGWDFGKRYLTLWGNPTTVSRDWSRKSSILKSKLFGEVKFPAFTLIDDDGLNSLAELYADGRFDYIQGYTNAIYGFADYLRRTGQDLPRVQGVLTTAETLQPLHRKLIEEYLGPVYDFYGCGEINGVASQCGRGDQYHIIDPHVYVEYGNAVDDEGNRELIITDLDNYAMPLIRYANGDMGLPGSDHPCECGLAFSRLGKISGRTSDIIHAPGGGTLAVPSIMGSRLLKELHGLVRYQAELVEPDRIVFKLQVNNEFDKAQEALLKSTLAEYLGGDFRWDLEYCELISPQKNGKYKLFVDRTTGQQHA